MQVGWSTQQLRLLKCFRLLFGPSWLGGARRTSYTLCFGCCILCSHHFAVLGLLQCPNVTMVTGFPFPFPLTFLNTSLVFWMGAYPQKSTHLPIWQTFKVHRTIPYTLNFFVRVWYWNGKRGTKSMSTSVPWSHKTVHSCVVWQPAC